MPSAVSIALGRDRETWHSSFELECCWLSGLNPRGFGRPRGLGPSGNLIAGLKALWSCEKSGSTMSCLSCRRC